MNTKIILLSLIVIFYQSKNLVGMERLNRNTYQEETRQSSIANPNLARSQTMDRSTISSHQEDPYPHYTILLGFASLAGGCPCEIYDFCDKCHKKWYEKTKKR